MAKHRIYLTENFEKTHLGNSKSTSYSFDGQTLRISWDFGKFIEIKAKVGDAFIVNCNGSLPTITKLKVPQRKVDKIAWILGFPKELRTYSYEDYKELIKKNNKLNDWDGYNYWEVQNEFYAYAICNQQNSDKLKNLAIYISPDIPNSDIVSLISEIKCKQYPKKWVKLFIKNNLNLSLEEFDEIIW